MGYISAYATDPGVVNKVNEDAVTVFIRKNVLYQIVSDGNGSVNDMKPAGFMINELQRYIDEFARDKMTPEEIKQMISQGCYCANRVLMAFKRANGEVYTDSNFATLTIAALTEKNELIYGHCGDSRLLLIRKNRIIQLTKDHTVAQQLYEQGKISRNQIRLHPDNVIITSAIGFLDLKLDVIIGSVQEGDIILGVTDGIHKLLDNEKIINVINAAGNCEDTCDGLIKYANSLGGFDNMAVFTTYIAE